MCHLFIPQIWFAKLTVNWHISKQISVIRYLIQTIIYGSTSIIGIWCGRERIWVEILPKLLSIILNNKILRNTSDIFEKYFVKFREIFSKKKFRIIFSKLSRIVDHGKVLENFKTYFRKPREILLKFLKNFWKILRIIAENWENYFIK